MPLTCDFVENRSPMRASGACPNPMTIAQAEAAEALAVADATSAAKPADLPVSDRTRILMYLGVLVFISLSARPAAA